MPSYLQSDKAYVNTPSLPVMGIKIRATERSQALFTVTSAIANSANNLDNQNHCVELTGGQWDTGLHKYS